MPVYLHPGVYIEEIPSGARSIEAAGTSITAFVGYATEGPIGEPTYITKWDQYDDQFGGLLDPKDFPSISTAPTLGHAVRAFYLNGGGGAYIVRVVRDGSATASSRNFVVPKGDGSTLPTGNQTIEFTAANEGEWGDSLRAEISEQSDGAFTLQLGLEDDDGDIDWIEKFEDLSFATDGQDFVSSVNNLSSLVTAAVTATGDLSDDYIAYSQSGDLSTFTDFAGLDGRKIKVAVDGDTAIEVTFAAGLTSLTEVAEAIEAAVQPTYADFTAEVSNSTLLLKSASKTFDSAVEVTAGSTPSALGDLKLGASQGTEISTSDLLMPISIELENGADGTAPNGTDYYDAFTALKDQKDVNIVCLPGQAWDSSGQAIIEAAIAHAETMKNRMVLIDPPSGTKLTTRAEVEDLGLSTSSYAALYYPAIEIANPLYDAEENPTTDTTLTVGPGGFVAGMYAKIDGRRGVWKAPAGTEAQLLGVSKFEYEVDDAAQDVLNPLGVNALRALSGYGNVIWGARTRATKANPPWRYVPVRRTAMMIEQSIYDSIQWAVFEPNDHRLWSGLRASIGGFMDGLFRAGAFQGQTASQAYHVRCGLGDTMTQDDIDAGQVIVIVGFAPLKPAEFVIIRIQQKAGQQ